MRIAYLGPEGTFTEEAALTVVGPQVENGDAELVPLPTIYDVVMAVHNGGVERGIVPIENSLEGSVSATLDTLAMETDDVRIVGETVHPIRQCLIARESLSLESIEVVVSHPQANGQCARFVRTRLPQARVMTTSSTADAVRLVAGHEERWAALGNRLAAELYGCEVLRAGVEDVNGNETRFVWLARSEQGTNDDSRGPWKTSIVFWGVGAEAPGWLVACLLELASRSVNLTRIESRPRKQALGRYMFFADLEGRERDRDVRDALEALRGHVETLKVLGSFPAAG